MKLIDTSCWIHQLHSKGDTIVRKLVEQLLMNGEAAWCPPVRLELWSGVGTDSERRVLREYEQVLPEYSITDNTWQAACDLADMGRRHGKRFPLSDLLVAACAREHGLELVHADRHFDELARLQGRSP